MSLFQLSKDLSKGSGATKNLHLRTTGKFYTPHFIAKNLINEASIHLDYKQSSLRIIDPFSGDGRLIKWFVDQNIANLKSVNNLVIDLIDIDEEALSYAENSIKQSLIRHGINHTLNTYCESSFDHFSDSEKNYYDLCITNPPWESLKPDKRELKDLTECQIETYIKKLKSLDRKLAQDFPTSQPKSKFSGWGTNLSRVGAELALKTISSKGICAIVAPSSLLADGVSVNLRKWMFENYDILNVSHYPAEMKLFEKVDQDSVTLIGRRRLNGKTCISFELFDRDQVSKKTSDLNFQLEKLEEKNYSLPNKYGVRGIEILRKIEHLPLFKELEEKKIWAGRELDETRDKQLFQAEKGIPFVKGKMIKRWSVESSNQFIKEEDKSKLPTSCHYDRIGWRDVSRPSQNRRMIATIIPKNHVTGNSVNVALSKNEDYDFLMSLLGIMNSKVFELQIRSYLSTSHISLGAVRNAHIPILTDELISIISKHTVRILKGHLEDELILEKIVSKAYGLSKEEFELVNKVLPNE